MVTKLVTTGYEGWFGPLQEMFGNADGRDSFYVTRKSPSDGRNAIGIDDDGDGRIDEDELDGLDNDQDGRFDEDFGAVSDNDAYVAYYDTNGNPDPVPKHVPLGIKVWQKSYSWSSRSLRFLVFPFEHKVINVGNRMLDSVYVSMFVDPDVGPVSAGDYFSHNQSGYDYRYRLAWVINPVDRPIASLGYVLLGASKPFNDLVVNFTDPYPRDGQDTTDAMRYECMSHGAIPDSGASELHDVRFLVSVGPFGPLPPGDTLSLTTALVAGSGLEFIQDNLVDNTIACRALYRRGFSIPPTPPSPRLRIKTEGTRVTLDWSRVPGDQWPNPLESWDEKDDIMGGLPQTHWRRQNPSTPGRTGGRNFEGFKVYRASGSRYDEKQFTLIAQYDVDDESGYGYQSGLKYTFVDSGLAPHSTYWYAVTSYSIPAVDVQHRRGPSGENISDTVASVLEMESDISTNATAAIIAPEYRLYACYPNPFNPSTNISFEIPERTNVRVRIFDILGREVASLADGPFAPGRYSLTWDASGQSAGVYFCRIETPGFTSTTKLILLR